MLNSRARCFAVITATSSILQTHNVLSLEVDDLGFRDLAHRFEGDRPSAYPEGPPAAEFPQVFAERAYAGAIAFDYSAAVLLQDGEERLKDLLCVRMTLNLQRR
jgi:hypothetical protein